MIQVSIEKKIKTYQGFTLLKVDHEFPENSITPIIGPSGSGKTTFLKILAGLEFTEKGIIRMDKEIWLDTDQKILIPTQKRNLGMVFQHYALFPNMTVIQHLEFATRDREWVRELLEFGKLDNLLRHKPEHLSGGQQQRLSLLRALARKPKVLLLDEPFSALDKGIKNAIISQLESILKTLGCTTLWVSHNPEEVQMPASEILKIG